MTTTKRRILLALLYLSVAATMYHQHVTLNTPGYTLPFGL